MSVLYFFSKMHFFISDSNMFFLIIYVFEHLFEYFL